MKSIAEQALLLFSGGQDSAICLFYALKHFKKVALLGFDYGQRHHIELQVRQDFIERLKEEFPTLSSNILGDTLYDLSVLKEVGETALTSETEIKLLKSGLPNSFVPARNLLFFNIAGAHAWRLNISHLIGGMCQTDYSGYPDCRDNTIKAIQASLSLGLDMDISIHTPLMWLSKAESWKFLYDLEGQKAIDFVLEYTHTCYKGVRGKKHMWGYGCGECPACILRKKGYEEFLKNG